MFVARSFALVGSSGLSRGPSVEPWWCREGVGVVGPVGIIAWSERRGKSWGGISGFKSRSGGAKRSDQVPARSRSLAEAGSGNPQGSAQAWLLPSQGPEGEGTPTLLCADYRTPLELSS